MEMSFMLLSKELATESGKMILNHSRASLFK